jgi:hypothetical protein
MMAEEKAAAKQSAPKAPAKSEKDEPDLKPGNAEAPGPITPEHESGSWEQTREEQEAREEQREARKS